MHSRYNIEIQKCTSWSLWDNRIGGVMVSMLASSAIDRRFEPQSGQTKDYKIGICCFSTKHTTLRRKSKDWSARNQNTVCEWSDMSNRGLLFQRDNTIKIQLCSNCWIGVKHRCHNIITINISFRYAFFFACPVAICFICIFFCLLCNPKRFGRLISNCCGSTCVGILLCIFFCLLCNPKRFGRFISSCCGSTCVGILLCPDQKN